MLKRIFIGCTSTIALLACTDAQVKKANTFIPVGEFPTFEEIERKNFSFKTKTFKNTAQNSKARIIHSLENTSFHFYNAAAFENEQKGILVGGTGMRIRSTLNGGKDWKEIRLSRFSNAFHSAAIQNGQAFAVGEGSFIVKSDATLSNWNVFDLKGLKNLKGDSQTLYKIKFKGQLGFAMGFDTGFGIATPLILKTLDGGANWTVIPHSGLENDLGAINDFDIVSKTLVYMVTQMGNTYKSNDGGNSWDIVFKPRQAYTNLNSIAFKNDKTGFISGISGLLYFTNDGGDNWKQNLIFKDSTSLNISDIQYINEDIIAITTAQSFLDEEKTVFSYLLDGNGNSEIPQALLTKTDSTIFFVGDAFHLHLLNKERLFINDRNNSYSLDVKNLSLK